MRAVCLCTVCCSWQGKVFLSSACQPFLLTQTTGRSLAELFNAQNFYDQENISKLTYSYFLIFHKDSDVWQFKQLSLSWCYYVASQPCVLPQPASAATQNWQKLTLLQDASLAVASMASSLLGVPTAWSWNGKTGTCYSERVQELFLLLVTSVLILGQLSLESLQLTSWTFYPVFRVLNQLYFARFQITIGQEEQNFYFSTL